MNLRIINGTVLIYDNRIFTTAKKDILIKENEIEALIETGQETEVSYEIYDAKNHLVMPGLINTHTHAYMSLFRNYADDLSFNDWLFKKISPVEDILPPKAAYWANLLGMAEMIRSGTTCFVDMHMYRCMSAKAASECKMRAYIGRGLVGEDLYKDGKSRIKEALDEKKEYESDLIGIVISPHAIYTASEKLYRQAAELADQYDLLKQTHLSETKDEFDNCIKNYGKTPVEYLRDTGFLDKKSILAHCVYLGEGDFEILKKSGTNVVLNPVSNAKLGNGFAPYTDLHDAGVNLCVGTDGAASNNTMNMFREMSFLSLFHKGILKNPTSAPACEVLEMSTVNAAKALGMEEKLGIIKEGAKADLIFVDLNSPSLFPQSSIVSSLCYSANGSEVDSVMVNGNFLMRNRSFLTIDYERVMYEVEKLSEKYLKK